MQYPPNPRFPSLSQVQVELKKGETIMTDASLHLPAAFLHETFSNRSGVPPDHFELYYRGKRLEGGAALVSSGIEKGSTIEVKMRGRGGAPGDSPGSGKPAAAGGGAADGAGGSDGVLPIAANQSDDIDMLKAKTMYNMVDELELGGSTVKLLFLKNEQARTIAKDPALIDLMIDKLVTKTPSLVINMLNSQGFQPWIDAQTGVKRAEGHAGVGKKAPFLSIEDESKALLRLDDFMVTVLIPLAAKTSALVICCATPCNCILSTSFTRMWRQQAN